MAEPDRNIRASRLHRRATRPPPDRRARALRSLGGTSLPFTVFAVVFVLAAMGARVLPERAGRRLDP